MSEFYIELGLKSKSKKDIINELCQIANKSGNISDVDLLIDDVFKREEETSTGLGDGFGMPHAQSSAVNKPIIIFGRSTDIEWESIDDKPTNTYFLILVPEDAGNEHLKILQNLARNLMNSDVQRILREEKNISVIERTIQSMLDGKEIINMASKKGFNIVAISNCPAGIAHTYMVAEGMEQKAKELGHSIKVETQGASGVENKLSLKDIEKADYVILALGKTINATEQQRFAGKKVIHVKVSKALKDMDDIFNNLEDKATLIEGTSVKLGEQKPESGSILEHLMAGVSAALPFVIGGGLLVAFANILVQLGMPYLGMEDGASFTWVMESIGYLGFTFMIPIMGAYTAYSIGDKPALAPAFIISYLANDKTMLQTEAGAGYLGAIVIGLSIGYFVKYLKQIKLPKPIQPLLTFTIIPFVTIFIFGTLTYYFLGPIMGGLMSGMLSFLNNMPPSLMVPTAFLVGAMLAFDMGGPVNKTAWLFCFALIDQGVYTWYGIVGVVCLLPPMAAGISAMIRPSLFSKGEQESALSTLIVGSTVATEPAIPYALSSPLAMISANVIAGGITGVVTILLGVERIAPGLGIVDPFLGLMTPWWAFYAALIFGVVLNVVLIIIFRSLAIKKREAKNA
ncbi:MAG: fructose-specific PTS transporter subunit EIIC [Mycoplasmatales bacterium]